MDAVRQDEPPPETNELKEVLKKCGLDSDLVAARIEARIAAHRRQRRALPPAEMTRKWKHPSILLFAGSDNPVTKIISHARTLVLSTLQGARHAAAVDPLSLAEAKRIPVVPNEAIADARLVPITADRGRIEYNPNRPQTRIRFSVAHELAHTFFADCWQTVRNRQTRSSYGTHEWELEMLCNIAAAELLMPIASFPELRNEGLELEHLMSLRDRFQVSWEALLNRVARITNEACIVFAASRIEHGTHRGRYRVEYAIPSRSWQEAQPTELLPLNSGVAECTAIGFTAKGIETWPAVGRLNVQSIGVLPHPGQTLPRVIGIARPAQSDTKEAACGITFLGGDATQPRGSAPRIIAFVVNDKTPNWGAGFALAVRKTWPRVQTEFQEWAANNRGLLTLGNVYHVRADEHTTTFPMICQHGYGPSPSPRLRYAALQQCLEQLADFALSAKATIHMPRIGSGFAGGSWQLIQELIDQILCARGLAVTIYDLPNAPRQSKEQPSLFD